MGDPAKGDLGLWAQPLVPVMVWPDRDRATFRSRPQAATGAEDHPPDTYRFWDGIRCQGGAWLVPAQCYSVSALASMVDLDLPARLFDECRNFISGNVALIPPFSRHAPIPVAQL